MTPPFIYDWRKKKVYYKLNTNFGIKKVQYGGFVFDGKQQCSYNKTTGIGESALDIDIQEVNTDKCIVIINGGLTILTNSTKNTNFNDRIITLPYYFSMFMSNTRLRIRVGCTSNLNMNAQTTTGNYQILSNQGSYQVIEFY